MKMMKRAIWIVALSFVAHPSAFALDASQLRELRTNVIEMCRGGTITGEGSKINVVASAEGKIVIIKKLMEGGADAKVDLTNEQWNGIKVLINPDTYTQCATEAMRLFLPALKAASP